MVPLVTIVNFVPRRVREGQHILHAEVCTENERCDCILWHALDTRGDMHCAMHSTVHNAVHCALNMRGDNAECGMRAAS